jgi:hypothetical protein
MYFLVFYKDLSDLFPIKNGLKNLDALKLLVFKFSFTCAIRSFGKPGGLEIKHYPSDSTLC